MKINKTQLAHGLLDEMTCVPHQIKFIHSFPCAFRDEIIAEIKNTAYKHKFSFFKITNPSVFIPTCTGMDYLRLLSYSENEWKTALHRWQINSALLKTKIARLSVSDCIRIQGLFAELSHVQILVIVEDEPYLDEVLLKIFSETESSVLLFSTRRIHEIDFNETWLIKGKRCLFIK